MFKIRLLKKSLIFEHRIIRIDSLRTTLSNFNFYIVVHALIIVRYHTVIAAGEKSTSDIFGNGSMIRYNIVKHYVLSFLCLGALSSFS